MSNVMWHVGLEPGTTRMQDVIISDIAINDFETIGLLLSTAHLKGQEIETEQGNYLLMYGGEYERPYPSIMIWRFENTEENSIIKDMRNEDVWIVEYVWREWLMPKDTHAEYVPPSQFIVMHSVR